MKELTLDTLLAVFEEMFGVWLFWALVAAAGVVTVLFVYALIRDRGISSRRLVRAELTAPVGALGAILFVQYITNSGFSDVGGPIDWIVLALIGIAGAVGLMILVYTLQSLLRRRQTD